MSLPKPKSQSLPALRESLYLSIMIYCGNRAGV
jgi:hypothetical protein